MKKPISLLCLVPFFLSACQAGATPTSPAPQATSALAEPESTPTEKITTSATYPPPTATITPVPSPTPSPTPEIQRTPGDPWERQVGPLPARRAVIAENNVAAVQSLARWGKGLFDYHVVNALRFSPDSKVLKAHTSAGDFYYDAFTLDELSLEGQAWQNFFPGEPLSIQPYFWTNELYRGDQLLLQLSPGMIALSPDESLAADYNEEYVLAVWETTSGSQEFSIMGQDIPGCWSENMSQLVSVGIAPGGQNLAVFCASPRRLFLLDFDGNAGLEFDLSGLAQDSRITSLKFSPDGSLLAGESVAREYKDAGLYVWRVMDGSLLGEFSGLATQSSQVQSMAISPDNRQFAAGYATGQLLVWEMGHPETPYPLHPEAPSYNDLAFTPDGSQIVVDFSNGQPVMLDASIGSILQRLEWPDSLYPWTCSDFEFSPDGSYLACFGYDTRVWELPDFVPVRQFAGQCCAIHFYPAGGQLAVIEENIVLHELPGGAAWSVIQIPPDFSYSFDFSKDGKLAVLGSWEEIIVLQAQQGGGKWKNVDQIKLPSPYKLVLSPDGKSLASVGDSDLWLYRVKKWELVAHQEREFKHFADDFAAERYGLVFSPDGSLLATGSGRDIHLRRASDGALIYTLKGHQNNVTSLAFSPDGTLLISGSLDGTLRLWGIP